MGTGNSGFQLTAVMVVLVSVCFRWRKAAFCDPSPFIIRKSSTEDLFKVVRIYLKGLAYLFIYLFVCLFIYLLFIYLFIYSFIHSF